MRSLFGAPARRARSSILCAAALAGLLVASLTPAAAGQPGEPAAPRPPDAANAADNPLPPPATPHVDAQGRPVDIHTPFHVTKVSPGKDDSKGWKPKSGQPTTAAASLSSAPLSPPFTECPPVGLDTSCQFLVVIGNGSHVSILQDPSQGHYDVGGDDSLVGIVNNSSSPVASVTLTSDGPIFGFDGDGICTVSPSRPDAPSAPPATRAPPRRSRPSAPTSAPGR